MQDATQGNAMTEIALAMAMGFFAIMVLTALSMGVGSLETKPIAAADVATPEQGGVEGGLVSTRSDDVVVIYARGRFHDTRLQPLDPAAIPRDRRVILAVPAELPTADALAARARIPFKNLVVSTMDERWRRAVGRLGGDND